ncbi:MAG: HAD-IC family P-type ATPase [Chromatiaceae bacterium]
MKPNADQSQAPEAKTGSMTNAKDDLKSLPMAEVEKQLASSPDGLSQTEAQQRLLQYGPNEIEEKKANPFLKFLTYLWGPIPWMIEAAVILSAVSRHWPDFGIILLLLVANAVVGFWEEHQAGNAIAALKAKLAIEARAKRDGKWTSPEARELVPGDVIRVRLGDIVPADARLLTGDPIEVDQSALTGESLPATRNPGEAVFSGSIIRQGEIDAMVFATGASTYFGKTAQLVQEALTVSHFQRAVLKIGNYLIILAATLVAVIITVALFRGDPMLTTLQFALVLTVAAIPVAMPTVLSVAGHLTIFLARTRGPFWSIHPARILLLAVFGTQLVATLIAVYGVFMTPLGWGWALFVWGYALAWFLVTDRVKLLAYRVFDPTAAPLLGKIPVDVTPQIAKRAYELYEQQGRRENHAVQDWLQAEREVRNEE